MGKVSIVGAGPGDPELITVKALRRIEQADVILYDRLVSEELLQYARADARRIYCGKSPGLHHMSQQAIHRTLLQYASAGLHVVRLKGGDPLVFGRGGEEALFLRERGINYEFIPGVTAAIGAAAGADIPLTHRGIATSFACVTASRAQPDSSSAQGGIDTIDPIGNAVRWDLLAQSVDTLAIYMGVSQLQQICSELVRYGRSPATPVAVIENGTTSVQRVLTGTLDDIYQIAEIAQLGNPALIIVGEVVRVREQLLQIQQQAQTMIG
ncbi:uroporphyrinogen-III C-methyltransferase [Paenibacillus bovis]|uniref:Uroporphyrinogen-III C-methyltransferase n=1 Tax=Paenibacillus bovis TaxID=1616788 RepID=A0A172ZMT7_9BACL|nr:uroporphyrinogen-III C-methyltransferase [Paenibacillus bovis]